MDRWAVHRLAVLIGMPCLAFIWGVFFVRWFDE